MIISRYTFLLSSEDNYYVYNTLSNAFLGIDETSYRILENAQSEKTNINDEFIDNTYFHTKASLFKSLRKGI